MFGNGKTGALVPISATDPRSDEWTHSAFLPAPLTENPPELSPPTWMRVADARAALAALDSTARLLPNPGCYGDQLSRGRPRAPRRSRARTNRCAPS